MSVTLWQFRRILTDDSVREISLNRYVVDSVLGKSLRILVSKPRTEGLPSRILEEILDFDTWRSEEEVVVPEEEAARMIGIRRFELGERRVFLQLTVPGRHPIATEVTKFVRQQAKAVYGKLLQREVILSESFRERVR